MVNAKRSRIKRKRSKSSKSTALVPVQRLTQVVTPKYPNRPRPRVSVKRPRPSLAVSDVNFLKAAFAPVDFRQLDLDGVPDTYVGPSIVKHHTYFDYISLEQDETKVCLVAPVPGMAYFFGNEYTSRNEYVGVRFPDFDSMFGPDYRTGDATTNVTGARYIGLSAEFRPVSALVSNAGAIVVAKVPLLVTTRDKPTYTPIEGYTIFNPNTAALVTDIDLQMMRTDRLTAGPFNMFHANEGAYAISGNLGDWNFTPINQDATAIPPLFQVELRVDETTSVMTVASAALIPLNGRLKAPGSSVLPCMCKNETIAFVLSNKGEAKLTYQLAIHAIVEYTVNPISILYPFAQASATPNRLVLDMYAEAMSRIPNAVPYYQNDGFWERVLFIWKKLLGIGVVAGAAVPGYGPAISGIAGGLQAITSGIEALTV